MKPKAVIVTACAIDLVKNFNLSILKNLQNVTYNILQPSPTIMTPTEEHIKIKQ